MRYVLSFIVFLSLATMARGYSRPLFIQSRICRTGPYFIHQRYGWTYDGLSGRRIWSHPYIKIRAFWDEDTDLAEITIIREDPQPPRKETFQIRRR